MKPDSKECLKITPVLTEKGMVANFQDGNGNECSIQESSATGNYLWLGCNEGRHHNGACYARMHIDQPTAKALIPLLEHFVQTGWLRGDYNPAEVVREILRQFSDEERHQLFSDYCEHCGHVLPCYCWNDE